MVAGSEAAARQEPLKYTALVNELQALWWPQLAASPLAEFSDKHLQTIGQQLNNWCLKPSASEGYRTAEVTLGGVDIGLGILKKPGR